MGWLNKEQQKEVFEKHHIHAEYICNPEVKGGCGLPIRIGEIMVVDSKGGYHPWPSNTPSGVKSITAREPKVTLHYQCDRIRRGKVAPPEPKEEKHHHHHRHHHKHKEEKPKEVRSDSSLDDVLHAVMKLLRDKPKKSYWNRRRLRRQLSDMKPSHVNKAVQVLASKGKIVRSGGGYLAKEKK